MGQGRWKGGGVQRRTETVLGLGTVGPKLRLSMCKCHGAAVDLSPAQDPSPLPRDGHRDPPHPSPTFPRLFNVRVWGPNVTRSREEPSLLWGTLNASKPLGLQMLTCDTTSPIGTDQQLIQYFFSSNSRE